MYGLTYQDSIASFEQLCPFHRFPKSEFSVPIIRLFQPAEEIALDIERLDEADGFGRINDVVSNKIRRFEAFIDTGDRHDQLYDCGD